MQSPRTSSGVSQQRHSLCGERAQKVTRLFHIQISLCVSLPWCRYDGPYTGKRELAGCGGGQPGIAQLPALQANQLAGNWVAVDAGSQQEPRSAEELHMPCRWIHSHALRV